jgi:ribosomal protein S17E
MNEADKLIGDLATCLEDSRKRIENLVEENKRLMSYIIQVEANLTRERVSGYTNKKREELLKHAREIIAESKK